MQAIFLEVEYVGTRYFGFQIQNKHSAREITVQEVIEKALKRLFNQDIRIDYTSRTDTGVHARAQGVSFAVDTKIPLAGIKRALNSFLPYDVKIKIIKAYPENWRVRYAVKSKIYRYTICNAKEQSVFNHDFSWHVIAPLSVAAIKKAALLIKGKKDFSLFAKDAKHYENPVRHVKSIKITKKGAFIYIDIEANGFLRNMARNIVSFLELAGSGKIALKQAKNILLKKEPYANKPAPAKGLCLVKVYYV